MIQLDLAAMSGHDGETPMAIRTRWMPCPAKQSPILVSQILFLEQLHCVCRYVIICGSRKIVLFCTCFCLTMALDAVHLAIFQTNLLTSPVHAPCF